MMSKPSPWSNPVKSVPAPPEALLPEVTTTDAAQPAPTKGPTGAKPPRVKKPVPKQAIVLGIAGGAVLGAILAYGVLSFIWWRRATNEANEFKAQVKADRDAELRKKAAEQADPMRSYSNEQRAR